MLTKRLRNGGDDSAQGHIFDIASMVEPQASGPSHEAPPLERRALSMPTLHLRDQLWPHKSTARCGTRRESYPVWALEHHPKAKHSETAWTGYRARRAVVAIVDRGRLGYSPEPGIGILPLRPRSLGAHDHTRSLATDRLLVWR